MFLQKIYLLTKIFADVLLRVQAEKSVTISKVHGYVKALYRSLEKFGANMVSETATGIKNLLDQRFGRFMDSDSLLFDPLFFVAAALDPNTAVFLTEKDFNAALREIQNLVTYEEPQINTTTSPSFSLDATLDQLLRELASENKSARKQKEIVQASAASKIRETMNRMLRASSPGMDALKYSANMMNTDAKPIAVLALEVLSIPATSAPVERVFSQAGLATARHRNRTSFELLNHQLVTYCNLFLEYV